MTRRPPRKKAEISEEKDHDQMVMDLIAKDRAVEKTKEEPEEESWEEFNVEEVTDADEENPWESSKFDIK